MLLPGRRKTSKSRGAGLDLGASALSHTVVLSYKQRASVPWHTPPPHHHRCGCSTSFIITVKGSVKGSSECWINPTRTCHLVGGSLLSAAGPDVCTIDTVELEGHVNLAPQLTSVPPNPATDSKVGGLPAVRRGPFPQNASDLGDGLIPASFTVESVQHTYGQHTRSRPSATCRRGGSQALLAGIGRVQAPGW